ncbi:MAG: heavy-metal-associated domain-containing protein [Clostridia bacterium]|nr:heavy-metal-associated domain-containing protein [Clostridia bacterium]
MIKHIIEAAIIIVIAAAVVFAIFCMVKKARYGGGCCGKHETAERKTAVKDRNKTHYPYTAMLRIEGMTCENCARRAENALNSLDGIWAKVDIGSHTAKVRSKNPIDDWLLIKSVTDVGYAVTDITRITKS